jgi:UDP-glucuronate 4-epimerase
VVVLLTGCAGFIGFHVAQFLLASGRSILGVDNLNSYYDVNLKKNRLKILTQSSQFSFLQQDIQSSELQDAVPISSISEIVHLAAQAGVRYSIDHPMVYGTSNLIGHLNILELARACKNLQNFVYASSSSVYGDNQKLPFSVSDRTDTPISLYAATKKSNELMSYAYSHLFQIPMTGLRFFTVYGPWGRPDMSAFLFTRAILAGNPIAVFNHGHMRRNFTYIEDIVHGTVNALNRPPSGPSLHRIYNIGNNQSENLMDFIQTIEAILGKKAIVDFQAMQPGDVPETIADIEDTVRDLDFHPQTSIQKGLQFFINWYREYYHV